MKARTVIHLDSFSGAAAELKPRERTRENVFAALASDPRVSTFDMSEKPWLRSLIADLKRDGTIVELDEPYPWHRYSIVDALYRAREHVGNA
jgi:hypothetical protein